MLHSIAAAHQPGKEIWKSIQTIAREANLSVRQVKRSLPNLEQLGELAIARNAGPNGTHRYELVGMQENCTESVQGGDKYDRSGVTNTTEGVTSTTGGGDKYDRKGVVDVTQKILEISEKEGEGAGRPTRLPDDFEFDEELRLVAEAETLHAERTFAKFVAHYRSATGPRARSADWRARFRKWCMDELDRFSGKPPAPPPRRGPNRPGEPDAGLLNRRAAQLGIEGKRPDETVADLEARIRSADTAEVVALAAAQRKRTGRD